MSKPNKNKIYLSSFLLIFCMLLFTALYGCGTGPDVAAGSTQPTPTGYNVALTADLTSVAAGNSTVVTATVTDGSGNPVNGLAVTFTLLIDHSVATLTTVGGTTNASGKAVVVYTAGATTPASSVQDTIQASVTGSTGAVIITRTASTAIPPTGYLINLTADVTSLAAGKNAIITATVTDGSGNPASGQNVTFALLIDNSVATLTPSGVVTTDASGRAVKVYTAGASSPATSVEDTVQASVTGANGVVIITRTASTATPPTGYRLTVTATPVSLAANAMSIIVAKVINSADGTDAAGVAVTFDLLIDNSVATLTTVGSGNTDAEGYAIATYTAGNHDPSLSIQDAVTASVTGSAGAVIITRLPTLGTGNRIISFTEIPETLPGTPVSGVVIMKVKVTTDNLTSPPSPGVTVTFSILAGGAGTLSSTSATTDTNGEAYVIFTRPATGSGETVVRAQIPGTINGGDAARIVYWTNSSGSGDPSYISAFAAALPEVSGGQMTTLDVTVYNLAGSTGITTNHTIIFTIPVNNSGASLIDSGGNSVTTITIPMSCLWNNFYDYTLTYKAGTTNNTTEVQDIVQAVLDNGSTEASIIKRLATP